MESVISNLATWTDSWTSVDDMFTLIFWTFLIAALGAVFVYIKELISFPPWMLNKIVNVLLCAYSSALFLCGLYFALYGFRIISTFCTASGMLLTVVTVNYVFPDIRRVSMIATIGLDCLTSLKTVGVFLIVDPRVRTIGIFLLFTGIFFQQTKFHLQRMVDNNAVQDQGSAAVQDQGSAAVQDQGSAAVQDQGS